MRSANGERIYVHEVSARDGFQAERKVIPTAQKIDYVNRLSRTGLAKIEVTSFTSPTAVPTLADADLVFEQISRTPRVVYSALVPNRRGCERALAAAVDEINVVMSVSEAHNVANLRMSRNKSLDEIGAVVQISGQIPISVSLSTAFGCPFEGEIAMGEVLEWLDRFARMGITRFSLCDTTGMANPAQVERLFGECLGRWPRSEFTAHFHNTRGMGLANVLAALESGVERFDASLGGLGGCPFAPGATGNICTEDLVHMLDSMGYVTGVDLTALLSIAADLPQIVEHEVPGQVVKAGPAKRRHASPRRHDDIGHPGSAELGAKVSRV
jgi:hydroxymethylglutaryl-CoA lyase